MPALLKWCSSHDDFHRLDALEALVTMGEDRVAAVVEHMLREMRPPVRAGKTGFTVQSHTKTIAQLVREMLEASPSRKLRTLYRRD